MRLRWVGAIVIALALVTSAACIGAILLFAIMQSESPTGEHVAVIEVHGQIVSRDPGGLFASDAASAERLIRELESVRDNDDVRAVLLDIDSPGGAVVPSEQIHDEIVRVRDSGIPVIAYFGNTAASGAYYIAAPADLIVANPATITGSIGVITQVPNLEELFDKIGVEMQTIVTGEFKDMMQPARPLTEAERALIAEIQDESLDAFVTAIINGRDMNESDVRELADGRIYSGRQAQENGLVDELGDFRDAVRYAGELAGLGSDPEIREYSPDPGFWDVFFGVTGGDFELRLPGPFGLDVDPRDLHLELRFGP